MKNDVHEGGMIFAAFITLLATVGAILTQGRLTESFDWVWIGMYGMSLLTLSGAVVNFDPKRFIK